jgi:hypothetical protein
MYSDTALFRIDSAGRRREAGPGLESQAQRALPVGTTAPRVIFPLKQAYAARPEAGPFVVLR